METHYHLLCKWGRRMNLTGLKDEGAIIRRHFLEPIAAADLIGEDGDLLDLGSGNGFPAIPLAVMHPGLRLILVEASERKSAFLWFVLRELRLKGARVVTRRVCRRADLADVLPVRWLTFRGIKVEDLLAGDSHELLERNGRLLAFVSEADSKVLQKTISSELSWLATRPLPASPGDVVAVFEARQPAQSIP